LTAKEAYLARTTLDIPATLTARLSDSSAIGILLSDDEAELLLQITTEHLMQYGLDLSYKPTSEGLALESLIDTLTAQDGDPGDGTEES